MSKLERTLETSALREIIKQNGRSDAPIKTERAEGEYVSCLVAIGPDETAEIILTKDALKLLENEMDAPTESA